MIRLGYGLSAVLTLFGIGNYSVGNVIASIFNFAVAVLLVISSTLLWATNRLPHGLGISTLRPPAVRRSTNISIVLNVGRRAQQKEVQTPDPTRDKVLGPD